MTDIRVTVTTDDGARYSRIIRGVDSITGYGSEMRDIVVDSFAGSAYLSTPFHGSIEFEEQLCDADCWREIYGTEYYRVKETGR